VLYYEAVGNKSVHNPVQLKDFLGKVIEMEKFVPKVDYSLELNEHSRVNLAFRYGIACEESYITAYFESYVKLPKNNVGKTNDKATSDPKSNRDHCYFTINGQKRVHAIMQGHKVITVYALSKNVFDTSDAKLTLQMFETSIQLSPNIFTMQEVVDWREKYLDSNGGVNKDTLRRELYKRKPNQLTAMEMLGLSDSFFDEIKELRDYVRYQVNWADWSSLDFSDKDTIAEHTKKRERLIGLGKNKWTTTWEETPEYGEQMRKEWDDWLKSDEYRREMQEQYESDQRDIILEILRNGEHHEKRVQEYKVSERYLALDNNERALKDTEIKEFIEKHHKLWLKRQEQSKVLEEKWIKFQADDEYRDADQETKDNEKQKYEDWMNEVNPFWLNPMFDQNDESRVSEVDQPKEKPEPVHGVPFGLSPAEHFNGKPCFFHNDCIVTGIKISEWKNGFHELHYENDKKRFITTTRQKWIIDKYTVGQRGVWTLEWGEGVFHLQQPMDRVDGAGDFHMSDEWQSLRYQKLKNSPKKCELCGSNEELHVDHKEPRSLRPDLELELSNLQILCRVCNLGKGNSDATDISEIPF
jgi:hypothetical protein